MISTLPDSIAVNAWVALLTPVALSVLAVINIVSAKLNATRGKNAEAAVTEVKTTLAKTSTITTNKLDTIHKLVNSEYAIALRSSAKALERIADMTKDPDDIAEAKVARQLSVDHDQKQHNVDLQHLSNAPTENT